MKRYIAKAKIEEGICLEGTIIEVYFVETPSGNLIEFTDHQAEIAKCCEILKKIRQPLVDGDDVPWLVQEIDDFLAQKDSTE